MRNLIRTKLEGGSIEWVSDKRFSHMDSARRFDLDLCKHHTWELGGMPGLGVLLVVLDRTPPVEGVSTGSVLSKTTLRRVDTQGWEESDRTN